MITYADVAALQPGFELKGPKHVAVLTHRNKILEVTSNRYACHAEELALWKYRKLHSHCTRQVRLFVVRVHAQNAYSRPCKHCCELLQRYPHIRVFYTTRAGQWQEEQNFDSVHVSRRRASLGCT